MKKLIPFLLILSLLLAACGSVVPPAQSEPQPTKTESVPASPSPSPTEAQPQEFELPVLGSESLPPVGELPALGTEIVTLDGISSYLRLTLPEGWTWEQAAGTQEGTVYGLYPEKDPAFKVELHYWAEGFPGLCGIGMSFSDYTLPDGRKANITYEISDEEIWWWMILPESPDAFSIQFGVPYALYEAHRAELEQMLGTIQLGVLASLDGPDVVETEEATG